MSQQDDLRQSRSAEMERETGAARVRTGEIRDLNRFIDFDVVDKKNDKVGTLDCLWSDHTGDPAFLGVKTGWIFGKTHVVPAHNAEVNQSARIIRLPYDADMIKGAPAYDADMTMEEATEREIYDYYHISNRPRMEETEERARYDTGLEHEASAPRREGEETARIQLHEEEVKIGKRQVEVGGVRLRKIIRTETVNQPVELQREEVVIERVPASEAGTATGEISSEQEIFIPLRREEAVVQKEARVTEEIRARKATETERQQVTETVRKEDVQVEKEGQDVRIRGQEKNRKP